MGSLKFLKKIRDKLDDYIEDREQARERRSSYNQPQPRSWSSDPCEEQREPRKSSDDKTRNYTDPDLKRRKTKMAGEGQARKMSSSEGTNTGRKSEGNLQRPRQSRYIVNKPGNGEQPRSPRKSDGVLVQRRQENQRRENRERGNIRSPRVSNERVGRHREDIPPVPPLPPQWTNDTWNNNTFSLRTEDQSEQPRKPQVEEYARLQREARAKKTRKQSTVDWDAMLKEKNEQMRSVAKAERREEEKKRRAAEQKWKIAEERRRHEEQAVAPDRLEAENRGPEAVRQRGREAIERRKQEGRSRGCQREFEETEKKWELNERDVIRHREGEEAERQEQEAKNREAEGQPEQEKAGKRRKAEEAEQNAANADKVKRENELRRLRAFGPQHQRRPTLPPPPATGGFAQGKPLEKTETNPVRRKQAGNSGQQHDKQDPRHPARRNSAPTTSQKTNISQNRPPVLALLTEENLRAQDADSDDSDIDPLGRGLGDNMRTFLYGFAVPSHLQSDLTPSVEEEEKPAEKKATNKRNE